MTDNMRDEMHSYAMRYVGPIVYRYVLWTISEARKRGIKRIWFLARDGYLPYLMAERVCKALRADIECKYLYLSRASLRMPTYSVDETEARRHLFSGGYRVSARSVLARADITGADAEAMLSRLGWENIDKRLDKTEQNELFRTLDSDGEFWRRVIDTSRRSYGQAIGYLRGEGLFDSDRVAIADSGWTGSMQRSLRILLESGGYRGKLLGFYFGMYTDPRDTRDGEYLTFYFNAERGLLRRVMFNNNLLECMLSAPHPTTVGYIAEGESVAPVFGRMHSEKMLSLINAQTDGALAYCDGEILKCRTKYRAEMLGECKRLVKRTMVRPTEKEAIMYSHFAFCDDVSEQYMLPVADVHAADRLPDYMLVPRILRKLVGKGHSRGAELFWVYGTVAAQPPMLRPWYRINILLWELLKAMRDRLARIKQKERKK